MFDELDTWLLIIDINLNWINVVAIGKPVQRPIESYRLDWIELG